MNEASDEFQRGCDQFFSVACLVTCDSRPSGAMIRRMSFIYSHHSRAWRNSHFSPLDFNKPFFLTHSAERENSNALNSIWMRRLFRSPCMWKKIRSNHLAIALKLWSSRHSAIDSVNHTSLGGRDSFQKILLKRFSPASQKLFLSRTTLPPAKWFTRVYMTLSLIKLVNGPIIWHA